MYARKTFGIFGLGLSLAGGCAGSPVEARVEATQDSSLDGNDEASGQEGSSTTSSVTSGPGGPSGVTTMEEPDPDDGFPATSTSTSGNGGGEGSSDADSTGAAQPPEDTGAVSSDGGDEPEPEPPWGSGRIPANCGWDPQDDWYACDNHGLSPASVEAEINCPAGLVEGQSCAAAPMSFQEFGCCDASGDTWYCSGSEVVTRLGCSSD